MIQQDQDILEDMPVELKYFREGESVEAMVTRIESEFLDNLNDIV